jgi:hypothetical protein
MPKDTRDKVTLSPEAYKALEVEAMLHGDSLKDTASKLILKAACPKCKEILGIMARPPKGPREEEPKGESDNGPKGPLTQEHNDTIAQGPDSTIAKGPDVTIAKEPKGERAQGPKGTKAKGKKLSEDTLALAKLKELYGREPRPSLVAMGKELGYSKSTVADNIKKLKGKRELE